MKIVKDAFIEKLSSVHDFKSYYSKDNCLLEAFILESESKNERYALVRLFVDLDDHEIPYAIFINNKEKVVFIDLVAGKDVIKNHLYFSPEQSVFASGKMQKTKDDLFFKQGDFLAAALLSAAEIKCNLEPQKGFEEVNKILNPSL